MKKHGFTLIEMLVVITIISLLLSILLPVVGRSRQLTVVTQCSSNQRQAFIALSSYGTDYSEYPCSGIKDLYEQGTPWYNVPNDQQIGERDGFGLFAFSYDGPYAWLKSGGYITTWAGVQCASKPAFPVRTNGWRVSGLQGNGEDYGTPALWFSYNGPHVWGPAIGNYGSNGSLMWLGGHHPWVNNSWGLSFREQMHMCYNNYRSGLTPVSEVGIMSCPGLTRTDAAGNPLEQQEPHMDNPQDFADDYGNTASFQTDGPIWTPGTQWQMSRNVAFGDGHVKFINRNNRSYTTDDQF